ncbi:hypothetical protein PR048_031964 [Dryococelus australis]|uniref:Uncharacterized protein n=1 Tax=Dryococelus australis TaxID=614101 RepID=A0ABQ9G6R8_9NEOP|nr:hypothetical protein PR048_031964 [Dryococelus australis]
MKILVLTRMEAEQLKNSIEEECKTCQKKNINPNSDLVWHLKIHPIVEAEYKKVNLINKEKASNVKVPEKKQKFKLDAGTVRAKAITNKIACMMAIDYQPYSIVEDAGLRCFVEVLEPKYNIPSHTTFSPTMMPALYQEGKQ